MKLFLGKKVGVSKEEKALSYYKFFEREMANIPAGKIALLDVPQEKSAVPFEEKNLYLAGKDKNYAQVGFCLQRNLYARCHPGNAGLVVPVAQCRLGFAL